MLIRSGTAQDREDAIKPTWQRENHKLDFPEEA
jgi:hypothetical protein